METLRLPARVVDTGSCSSLNLRLRENSLSLDWSEVTESSPDALAALLHGITLDAPPDGLNIDSIPEALHPAIEAILSGNAAPAPKKAAKKKPASSPAIWRTPSEAPPPSVRRRLTPTPPPSLLASEIPTPAEIRAELEQKVVAELLGPAGGEHEEIEDPRLRPSDRYLLGLLAPRRTRVGREEIDTLEAAASDHADDNGDDETGLAADTMFPSSIGISFCVQAGARLRVHARWGRYARTQSSSRMTDAGNAQTVWKRTPMGGTVPSVEAKEGPLGPFVPDADQKEVLIRGIGNRVGDVIVVSLFLVNMQEEPEKNRDEGWLFQPELTVSGDDGGAPFVGRAMGVTPRESLPRDEDRAVDMQHRDRVEFAVGHGIGANVDVLATDPCRATCVRTRTIPRHELAQQEARRPPVPGQTSPADDPLLSGLVLDMKELAETPSSELGGKLSPILVAYQSWIDEQEKRISQAESRLVGFEASAKESLDACRLALKRLRAGIDLLGTDELVAEAFRFANRSMWLQRIHTVYADRRRRGEPCALEAVDLPANRTWRTFQLAFVLLTIEGLAKLDHPDRTDPMAALADLLWFPTGGGKTEAYLGCTAFVLALRRLQGDIGNRSGEHGVAVLMRYTLRLLTIQQFQRAAALICACEHIRREATEKGDKKWGHEPFRLGLWVGARTTPNRTEHADEALKQEKRTSFGVGAFLASGSPVQLKSCPWCGMTVDPGKHMRVDSFSKGAGRTLVFCGDERGACLFSARQSPGEGIPVLVVDEEIYRKLPALLIATVDKFAQMPWNGQVQMLFGRISGKCTRHGFRSPETRDTDTHPKSGALGPARTVPHSLLRPPDLIIQDELHLISGPLGTLTGLYETAVDELCTWEVNGKRVRPKIIASTATVRRAKEQVHSLFARKLAVFPPPGLDADDNFFAVQRDTTDVPGRLYIGLCAPGRRLKGAIIRVYVALLTAAQALYDRYGKHADPWMSLVGYFTSLRELAGTRRLVDDDVRNRVFRMERTGLARRKLGTPQELTSRLGATDIPVLLDWLELPFDPSQQREKGDRKRNPIDVLLATNMISVGVDVRRLGLMVCTGQPKTTAEYIQATSRVGRAHPGLVCTIYNWARPRDLSHYETFEHYHATFYEHVEALSVTPFASRALDRGLSALLVSLIRQNGADMNLNSSAASIDASSPAVQAAIETIRRRAELVEESQLVGNEVKKALEVRVQEWVARAKPKPGAAKLGYKTEKDGQTEGLLLPAGGEAWDTFTCLNSLRDVEPTVTLLLDEGRMDDMPGETVEEKP